MTPTQFTGLTRASASLWKISPNSNRIILAITPIILSRCNLHFEPFNCFCRVSNMNRPGFSEGHLFNTHAAFSRRCVVHGMQQTGSSLQAIQLCSMKAITCASGDHTPAPWSGSCRHCSRQAGRQRRAPLGCTTREAWKMGIRASPRSSGRPRCRWSNLHEFHRPAKLCARSPAVATACVLPLLLAPPHCFWFICSISCSPASTGEFTFGKRNASKRKRKCHLVVHEGGRVGVQLSR